MFAAKLEKVKKKLNKMFRNKQLINKKIYLFGVSDNTRQIIGVLRKNGYEPIGVVDNDENKIGSYCSGLEVKKVNQVPNDKDNVWLLYSYFHSEMRRQLMENGVEEGQIYTLYTEESNVFNCLRLAYKGRKIYLDIKKQYGNVPIFLCPYTGTGDIYLIGTFWNEYIKSKGIDDYVFIVISGACKKVATIFNIRNIHLLKKQTDSDNLIYYYNLCPDELPLTVLNDAWAQINDNSTEWFRGYKGQYFTDLFRKWVFDLPNDSKPEHPVLKNVDDVLEELFEVNGLKEKKTVVLSPYSNTLSDLPVSFWERICDGLIQKGFDVVTNSSGWEEPPIKGSKGIFFPLDIAPQFINKAGAFIGVRSGFCDVISNCNAKKVILYDLNNYFFNCRAFDYFSLKKMGLCSDAIEIQFDRDKLEEINENIINQFERNE